MYNTIFIPKSTTIEQVHALLLPLKDTLFLYNLDFEHGVKRSVVKEVVALQMLHRNKTF